MVRTSCLSFSTPDTILYVIPLINQTLDTLPTDLVGRLYKTFDPFDPVGTIPEEMKRWVYDKGIVKRPIDESSPTVSCFISYSSEDEDFARKLYKDLQDHGVRCWFAPEDMKIGSPIRPALSEAVRLHDKLLLILSIHSIKSPWVEDEVESAFERERRGRSKETILFPVRIDDAIQRTRQAWASKLRRQRHIGDFRGWDDSEKYGAAFEHLLRDLSVSP